MQIENSGYVIDDDKTRLDLNMLHGFISRSYWAEGIPRETIQRSIAGSDCYGIYHNNEQVGFARVISDHATFAYIADVFVLPAHRSKGLARWLMEAILARPSYQGLRRWLLATRDAHGLYQKLGFTSVDGSRFMEIRDPDVYQT